jgi:hypothetical protein
MYYFIGDLSSRLAIKQFSKRQWHERSLRWCARIRRYRWISIQGRQLVGQDPVRRKPHPHVVDLLAERAFLSRVQVEINEPGYAPLPDRIGSFSSSFAIIFQFC